MTKNPLIVSGPYTHENLAIFLFHGADEIDGGGYTSLTEAFEEKHVLVHETGTVGQLEVENLSETLDIFIQAGDVLKGGRQDRTIAIDFIIPVRSGRIPIPAFCVEMGRWHKRGFEDAAKFSSSTHAVHAKSIRLAAKRAFDQDAVWRSVAESQEELGSALNKSMHASASPTSYQLSVEDRALEKKKREYDKKLRSIAKNRADVIGYAFYVNGERNTADIYGSTSLFHKLWKKLLDVAVLEAISGQNGNVTLPDKANLETWLKEAGDVQRSDTKKAAPRTRLHIKSYPGGVVFETFDEAVGDQAVLHTNVISK
jgi:ARG/rhodanese/phosphatase superfamily protein